MVGIIDGRVAQLVEQLTLNQWVRSSSLRAPTIVSESHEETTKNKYEKEQKKKSYLYFWGFIYFWIIFSF